MVGRGYCLEDSCATIWVKKPKKITTKEISYTFNEIVNPNFNARPFWGLQTIEASGWDLESDYPRVYPYPDMGNNSRISLIVANIIHARDNNIEGNEMPTWNRYLTVARGSYRGTIPTNSNDRLNPNYTEVRGFHEATETDFVNGGRITIWSGEVDAIFISTYEDGESTKYDINILPRDGNRIETVVQDRLYTLYENGSRIRFYDPQIETGTSQPTTTKLTLYDVDGIAGNTQVIERLYSPVTFLEVREKEEIDTTEYLAVQIKKRPWFDRLEVVHFAYNFTNIGIIETSRNLLEPFAQIDDNCLNVYVTSNTPSLIPSFVLPEGYIEPIFPWETELKQQICNENDSNNLPQYIVVCGCKAECPPGTCEVDCGDHFCCYDSLGISVASLTKSGEVI